MELMGLSVAPALKEVWAAPALRDVAHGILRHLRGGAWSALHRIIGVSSSTTNATHGITEEIIVVVITTP